MNNFKSIRRGLLLMLTSLMAISCVQDDDYDVPPIEAVIPCTTEWKSNITIGELINKNVDGAPLLIEEDLILEGYVVSTDRKGNFYRSLVIQDSPSNPTYGMSVELDLKDTYRKFPVGGKVLVNAKGLYFGKDKATYKIGSTYVADNGETRLGRMSEVAAIDKVKFLCDSQVEIVPQTFATIADFKANAVVNTLVKLENVQFNDITEGSTYYEEKGSSTFAGATNRELIDAKGDKIVLRTSKYTDFAGEKMPMGSGTIIAILSAYSNNNNPTPSTYQLLLRDVVDVQMDNPRFGDAPTADCEPWVVNTTLADVKALNATEVPMEITTDLVFAGYVISNDEAGNFYKTISIQDSPENPTAGMSIEMDVKDIYKKYPVGSKILVNAKGMFVAKDKGTYKIGSVFTDNGGNKRVGRLTEADANSKVSKSCDEPVAIVPTKFNSIQDALKEGLINTLIKLEGVKFSNAGTYFVAEGNNNGYNQELVDNQGFKTVLRTSKFAKFANDVLPTSEGSLTVVLSAYAANNDLTNESYQLYIRDKKDVEMN